MVLLGLALLPVVGGPVSLPEPKGSAPNPQVASAASGSMWKVPVVSIRLLDVDPDGTMNLERTGFKGSQLQVISRIDRMEANNKFSIEEGSRDHGYRNPNAKSALGVRIIKVFTFSGPVLLDKSLKNGDAFQPDYRAYLEKIGAKDWVEKYGVKEFWFWHQHKGEVGPVESNMAGSQGEDISNSYRYLDLDKFKSTYTVYGFNYARGFAMAVHNRCHQLEALLREMNERQDKNRDLFMNLFCGYKDGKFAKGRVGDCHHPPNADKDYDYYNKVAVMSDIEDWLPSGGTQKPIDCTRWQNLVYKYPYSKGANPDIFEGDDNWYIYWMQNFPGKDSKIPYKDGKLSNWWIFMAEWDYARDRKIGLWRSTK